MKTSKLLLCGTLALLLSHPALAAIEVEDAYVRGLPPGVDNTAAYMVLRNTSDTAMTLTGASTPVAGMAMLHKTSEHEGMMHMDHMDAASIPAHGELKLAPNGIHLMLMKLKQALKPGDKVELTLQFGDGSTQTLSVPVRSVLQE